MGKAKSGPSVPACGQHGGLQAVAGSGTRTRDLNRRRCCCSPGPAPAELHRTALASCHMLAAPHSAPCTPAKFLQLQQAGSSPAGTMERVQRSCTSNSGDG